MRRHGVSYKSWKVRHEADHASHFSVARGHRINGKMVGPGRGLFISEKPTDRSQRISRARLWDLRGPFIFGGER